jgi:molybdenum cofactor cytidylyltransferase
MNRTAKIAAIVLAAGRSSRMLPRNKLLEPYRGNSIIASVAETAIASGADPVIVVTGFDVSRIVEAIKGLNVTVVHNARFEEGLSTSLRVGLDALPPGIDGALVLLGDMPEINGGILKALTSAFANPQAICVPVRKGRRGNPVLWGAAYFTEMMRIAGDVGAKEVLAEYSDALVEVPIASDAIFADLDTPADLARLNTRLKSNASKASSQ